MIRYGGVVALVALLAICGGQATAATEPAGPRLALVIDGVQGPSTADVEGYSSVIATVGFGAPDARILVTEPYGTNLSWSADGRRLALAANGYESSVVAVLDAETSHLRTYPRASLDGGEPLISPDGRSVVFPRVDLVKVLPGRESYLYKGSVWSLDLERGSLRRLTPWRLGRFLVPTSFSPDGSRLAAEYHERGEVRAVAIDLASGRLSPLVSAAAEPTFSPDGSRLAFVRLRPNLRPLPKRDRPVSELLVAAADGSNARRLVRRRGYLSYPAWDPSGSFLTLTRNPPGPTGSLEPEPGNAVLAVNADGSCLTRVFSDPELTVHGGAWRPGPGRAAGPIVC